MNLDELRELGARPVREDAPCGDPVRDEPDFEVLQTELRKLELPSGEQPDWPRVAELASRLLSQKSKDLLVACFLAYAAFRIDGYAGLTAGLYLLTEMSDRYWDGLYPEVKRMRGRLAALEWFASRTAREVETREIAGTEVTALEECRKQVGSLGDALEVKADGAWALFGELRSALEEATRRIEMPPAAPPPPAEPVATAAPVAPAPSAPSTPAVSLSGPIHSPEDASQAIQSFRTAGLALAEQLRLADPRDSTSYRLRRQMAWLALRELPPATDGVTKIPAPQPADQAARMEEMVGRGQWPGLLEMAEGRLPAAVMWLDLNRFTWTALDAMGMEYMAAADAVRFETSVLLRRLPGLERLRFASGVPLADAATCEWIRRHVSVSDGETPGGVPAAPTGGSDIADADETADLHRLGGEARALLRQKKAAEAVRLLEERAFLARSLRSRLRWGLEVARLLHEARGPETASLRLRALFSEADAARIEDWDSALAVEMAKSLLLSLSDVLSSGHHPMGDEAETYRDVRARLCRIDPASALAAEQRR